MNRQRGLITEKKSKSCPFQNTIHKQTTKLQQHKETKLFFSVFGHNQFRSKCSVLSSYHHLLGPLHEIVSHPANRGQWCACVSARHYISHHLPLYTLTFFCQANFNYFSFLSFFFFLRAPFFFRVSPIFIFVCVFFYIKKNSGRVWILLKSYGEYIFPDGHLQEN